MDPLIRFHRILASPSYTPLARDVVVGNSGLKDMM